MSPTPSNHTAVEQVLFRKCYFKGVPLFFYGLLWLLVTLIGLLFSEQLFSTSGSLVTNLLAATYASALTGAAGGATAMLVRLYEHIAAKQDFLRQSMVSYIVQPFVGLLAGLLMLYIITIPATLLLNFVTGGELRFAHIFVSPTQVALQMLLAWIAGFYQRQGLDKARSFLNKSAERPSELPADMPLVPIPIDKDDPMSYKQWTSWRKQMILWSFTWGLFILLYGVFWVIGLVASYLMAGTPLLNPETASSSIVVNLVWASWPVAVAGGIGGVVGMLNDLGRHISIKQDFHRQHLMAYLVQPVIGVMFGMAMYFFIAAGYLAFDAIRNPADPAQVVDSSTVIMAQMVLGVVVGFRQQSITRLIHKLLIDLVTFIKLVGKLLQPKNLFKKANRDQVLAEIAQQTGLFKPTDRDNDSESSSNSFNWLAPD